MEGCVGNHQIHNFCAQTSETHSQFSIPRGPSNFFCTHGPSPKLSGLKVVAGTWADEMGFRGGHRVSVWAGAGRSSPAACCSRYVDVILLEMLIVG